MNSKELIAEAKLDAKAFRENTVYDSDGEPIRLIANADRLDQYAAHIAAQDARIEALEGGRDAFREAGLMALAAIDDHNSSKWGSGLSHIGDYFPMVTNSAKIKSLSEARTALGGEQHGG